MKAITRFTRDVGVAYASAIVASFLTGVTAGLFPSAVLGAVTEYEVYGADWYMHYWYFVCMAILGAIAQYYWLHRAQTKSPLLMSVLICLGLFVIYSAMIFPDSEPILDGIHVQWIFPIFLAATFQFAAIVLYIAIRLISKMIAVDSSVPAS